MIRDIRIVKTLRKDDNLTGVESSAIIPVIINSFAEYSLAEKNQRMRILLIHQYFMRDINVPGGTRWNAMAKVWTQQKHQLTVLASMYNVYLEAKYPGYEGKLLKHETSGDGLDVIWVHTSAKYNRNFLWRAWAYFTFVFFGFLGILLFARGSYDLVLATSPPITVGPLGVLASIIKRCPFVFEVRDLWTESTVDVGVVTNPLLIKLMRFMEKFSYRKAHMINVLTPSFREKLIKNEGILPDKIWVIPNGADLDITKSGPIDEIIRARHGWGDKFVGLYMGSHGRVYCLWQLIEAAKILKDEREFLIACVGGGMDRKALIEKAKDEGLTNIQFLPSVPKKETAAYFRACNVSLIVLKKA
jgi:glycosyltransferase involved in cell wall biosynthesis